MNKSAMQMLEDIFLMTSPPLQRKLDLFRVGQNGRTFSTWSTELHNLADEAKLDTLTSEEILVLLYIIGADDGNLQDKFLTEYEPTLKTIERIGFQYEITSNSKQAVVQSKIMAAAATNTSSECNATTSLKELRAKGLCIRCGGNDHNSDQCKFKTAICRICNIQGHIAKVCQSALKNKKGNFKGRPSQSNSNKKKNFKSHTRNATNTQGSEPQVMNTTSVVLNKCYSIQADGNLQPASLATPRIDINVKAQGQPSFNFKSLPDTGATRTIIAFNLAKRNGIKPQRNPNERLYAANGQSMACEGTVMLTLAYNGITVTANAIVSSAIRDEILICWHDLIRLNVIHETFPASVCKIETVDNLDKIKKDYPDVLSDKLPDQPIGGKPMKIHLQENAVSRKVLTPRAIPIHWENAAKEFIDQALSNGIIEKVPHDAATDWISPGFFVPKGDYTDTKPRLRLVVDYTNINKYVNRPVHPFPHVQQVMTRIPKGSKIFCKNGSRTGVSPNRTRQGKFRTDYIPFTWRSIQVQTHSNGSKRQWRPILQCHRHGTQRHRRFTEIGRRHSAHGSRRANAFQENSNSFG